MPETTINRVAYSPGEFAKMFGKSQTWGYREIYRGNVNAITEHGRILIPAKEVERVLESAGIYNGREKPKVAEERIKKMTPEQKSIWQRFLELRREPGTGAQAQPKKEATQRKTTGGKVSRSSTMQRLAKSWRKGG
ncbi:hypothetical protein [Prosthecobacter sp.]|uniref:hypothetical protein n=1 Tax=Prosthecobacter sp. TaxID=1965333 RepID=UPI003783F169